MGHDFIEGYFESANSFREVLPEEGQELAKKFNFPYFEVCSGTNSGVEEMFVKLISEIYSVVYKDFETILQYKITFLLALHRRTGERLSKSFYFTFDREIQSFENFPTSIVAGDNPVYSLERDYL